MSPRQVDHYLRIIYDPAIQITGTPTIEGHSLPAEHMASHFFELGEEEAQDDYGLTREELIVACWWAAHWGPRKFRKAWKEWGERAGSHLRYGCINVPLPPTKSDIAARDQQISGSIRDG